MERRPSDDSDRDRRPEWGGRGGLASRFLHENGLTIATGAGAVANGVASLGSAAAGNELAANLFGTAALGLGIITAASVAVDIGNDD